VLIEIYTKNFALTKELEVEAQHVPRVGETITLGQDGGYLQGTTELLVHDVTHVLKNDKLTPLIKCHASNGPINRRIILEEGGWL
jgi:hypothetical protein